MLTHGQKNYRYSLNRPYDNYTYDQETITLDFIPKVEDFAAAPNDIIVMRTADEIGILTGGDYTFYSQPFLTTSSLPIAVSPHGDKFAAMGHDGLYIFPTSRFKQKVSEIIKRIALTKEEQTDIRDLCFDRQSGCVVAAMAQMLVVHFADAQKDSVRVSTDKNIKHLWRVNKENSLIGQSDDNTFYRMQFN